jgi:hypothetical protein
MALRGPLGFGVVVVVFSHYEGARERYGTMKEQEEASREQRGTLKV